MQQTKNYLEPIKPTRNAGFQFFFRDDRKQYAETTAYHSKRLIELKKETLFADISKI